MTRTRNISDLLDSNGDVKSGSLDNVPAVDLTNLSATNLTSGTIPDARFPSTIDGRDLSVDGSKLDGIEASATADQTASEIRTLVESASDSNVFTDADHTKLNGIEASATADQTAAEILTAVKTVDGASSGLDADILDGEEGSYYTNASNLSSGTIPDARFPATLPALNGSNLTNLPPSGLPSGTKALFVQTAAPTGWTKDTTHNDKALRIVSGSVGTGGSTAFSSALATPSLSISVSGSTGSTTISTSTMPSHNHGITSVNSNQAGSYYVGHGYGYSFSSQGTQNTNSTGGGGSHNHSLSASASGTAAINVQYVDVIIATKD